MVQLQIKSKISLTCTDRTVGTVYVVSTVYSNKYHHWQARNRANIPNEYQFELK